MPLFATQSLLLANSAQAQGISVMKFLLCAKISTP